MIATTLQGRKRTLLAVLAATTVLIGLLVWAGLTSAQETGTVAAAPLQQPPKGFSVDPQTEQDTAFQNCSVQYVLSPSGGTIVPGSTMTTTFTAQWLSGACTWDVSLSSPGTVGVNGITMSFAPASGAVNAEMPIWHSTGTITVTAGVAAGYYQIPIYVDASADGVAQPRRTFVFSLFVTGQGATFTPTTVATGTATVTPTPGTPTPSATPGGACTDFAVVLNSNQATIWPGALTIRTLTVGHVEPANATWTFAAEGTSPGITVDFAPASFTGTGMTQIWIGASAGVSPGTYTFNLRPICNGESLEAQPFTLNVVSAPADTPTSTSTLPPADTATPTPTTTTTATAPPTFDYTIYLPLVGRNMQSTGAIGQPDATSTPTATSVPAATPSPTATTAREVIFSDDFSNALSGWTTANVSGGTVGYQDGEYRTWARPILNGSVAGGHTRIFTDFDAEVSARALAPPVSGAYLLLFRYQNSVSYYYFRVSPSLGNYDLYKVVNGVQTQLVAPTESSAILTGTATNRLRVVAQGSALRLYVNGQFLTEVTDSSLSNGNFLLGAWNFFDAAGTPIHWDDFVVYSAGTGPTSEQASDEAPVLVRP